MTYTTNPHKTRYIKQKQNTYTANQHNNISRQHIQKTIIMQSTTNQHNKYKHTQQRQYTTNPHNHIHIQITQHNETYNKTKTPKQTTHTIKTNNQEHIKQINTKHKHENTIT